MRVQRWQVGSVVDAEILSATVWGLIGDEAAVAAIVLDPKGRDGLPTVLLVWQSSDGVIREQIRNALYPVEPLVRDVEAALEMNATVEAERAGR
jgi:hypothetical protein